MDSFLTPLQVQPLDDGVDWKVLEPFECQDDVLGLVTVPAGRITDFASIPWVLRPLVGEPWGWYGKAAVVHDENYKTQKFSRLQSDDCLLRGMKALINIRPDGMGSFHWFFTRTAREAQMYEIYWGVRAGGFVAWNQHTKELKELVKV